MAPRPARGRSTPRSTDPQQPASGLAEEIARIDAVNVDALRSEWRRVLGSDPPSAFSKDLLARAIAYRLQEHALGGLSPSTARLMRSLLKPGVDLPRQVKVGSVIVREHKGVVHEVLVTPGGFCWQGQTYDSLSTIAKKITGVSWNGPRFFGLRSKKQAEEADAPAEDRSSTGSSMRARAGRRSSLRSLSRASGART